MGLRRGVRKDPTTARRLPQLRNPRSTTTTTVLRKPRSAVLSVLVAGCLVCLVLTVGFWNVHVIHQHGGWKGNVDAAASSQRTTTTTMTTTNKAVAASTDTDNGDDDSSSSSNPLAHLPQWIQSYVEWHGRMRRQFPGKALLEDPDGPAVLIRTCLGLCGGLNDRLGQLPWDLYLANQTNRVLLLHWHRPVALEHFLVPTPYLNWSVPSDLAGFWPRTPRQPRVSRQDMRLVRDQYPDLFDGYGADHPTDDFWLSDFPAALERAIHGEYAQHRVLRHRLLGHLHEEVLEAKLQALGETDGLHRTASFGRIFRTFFQPSPGVRQELTQIRNELNLAPARLGQKPTTYTAVHCRVRHPKAQAVHVLGKVEGYTADKGGLPWEGSTRAFAIDTATYALQCAATLQESQTEPVYFFSDSNDLVHYVTRQVTDKHFLRDHQATLAQSPVDQAAIEYVHSSGIRVIARNATMENAHIDKQKGRSPEEYYGTFVDLYLAIHARCITYGIGFYAILAAKISHTSCKLLYDEEAWGKSEQKKMQTQPCRIPRHKLSQ